MVTLSIVEFLEYVKNINQSDDCKIHVKNNVNEASSPTGDSDKNNCESFTSEQDKAVRR